MKISVHANKVSDAWTGHAESPTGLLVEASDGSLQRFLDTRNDTIPLSLRTKEAIESVAYVHNRGVDMAVCPLIPSSCILHQLHTL